MTIIIGIDPHKASHTAVAIDHAEVVLDEFRLRALSNGPTESVNTKLRLTTRSPTGSAPPTTQSPSVC